MKIAHTLWSAALLTALVTSAHAQLRIGQPSGFTGSAAAGVKENTEGAKLYIDAVNRQGGVHGQQIELVTVDDKFDPATTAKVGRALITEKNVLALFLNRGTPHSQALLPILAELRVPLVAPSTGAMVLHDPVNPWVFNVRATYQREAIKAIHHLASLGVSRIAVLQTDDSFGADAALGAEKGFAATGLKPALLQKFPREKPDLAELASKVKASDAQAVLYIGSSNNVASGVKALRESGQTLQVVTLSNNASEGFIKALGEHARGVIVTQVFPNERAVNYRLIKEAQELAKTKGLSGVSPAMIEGFAAAKVLVEGLRRAGPKPTPSGLRDALESMHKFDLGGLDVSYSANDHSGLDFADLSIIGSDGKFMR
ncbi:ABC transporter substrate-binding protein [Rhodoferax sp. AJA081-3]|uniref:ABC transporter substrate-binding protein n=1 Tax=Rhodoferax sp. AJA081-3 TaxID=2752316 RepID=UPI001ADEE0BB|nr:ABC transporter substrate-binding protein [Rhodoferax sp. AJA081-3]QTN30165.1 ABC transporter substrate-binding protein [Rhodoferax sp. AJA081-3]